jgi:hypothetical protein
MSPVIRSRRVSAVAGGLAAALALCLPAGAPAQDPPSTATETATTTATPATTTTATGTAARQAAPTRARVKVGIRRLSSGKVDVGKHVMVIANLHPFVRNEKVKLQLLRNGHVVRSRTRVVRNQVVGNDAGRVKLLSPRLLKPGHYRGKVIHKASPDLGPVRDTSRSFTVHYPSLNGGSNDFTALLNDLLNRNGYANAPGGRSYSAATRRAVLAFRKTNNMRRITSASSEVVKMLADGRGRFKPKYPGAGKHVEVDISRQVMALINGKAQYTYHVSTGAPATPTVRGHYRFYRREPGFNSHGMYYSVYFIRGYAIHGYASVPTYNASHGCVRNPIPDSKFIYNWVSLGMSIYTYA